MLKSDETLDFHNAKIAQVAFGEKCPNSDKSCAYILTSPLGHVYTNACPIGLHCVKLYGDTGYGNIKWDTKVDFIRASSLLPSNPHAVQLKKWLQMYFSNPLRAEEIPISFCGLEEYGEFNSKIWMTIRDTCPPGEMMSYRELGERSGYGAGSSKVVGYAINKNPYMLVVGDHRVVKATGEIWCENDSQRNKLRRLLVKYEIGFTRDSLESALLKVKERNEANKPASRKKDPSSAKTNKATKSKGIKKKTTSKKKGARKGKKRNVDETDSEEDSEDDED